MIVRKSISDQVFDYLVDEIKGGRLKPGDKLDTERAMAEKLGVSRVSIREAVSSLNRMGVLVTKQGGGTYVNSKIPDMLSKAMDIYLVLDENLVLEFMEVRKLMESEAARLASENATPVDIKELREIHEKRKALTADKDAEPNHDLLYEYDRQFHRAIAKATHNTVFGNFIDAICTTLRIQQREASKMVDMPVRSNEFHEKILNAITEGNGPLAMELMTQHLEEVCESIRNSVAD